MQAIGTASDPALLVGAGYAALRVSRRFRVSAAAGVGGSDGQTAWRGELLAHFLLRPGNATGSAPTPRREWRRWAVSRTRGTWC